MWRREWWNIADADPTAALPGAAVNCSRLRSPTCWATGVNGLFILRTRRGSTLARDLHDPRSHHPRTPDGPCLRLSRLLGAGVAQDGLQGSLPAAGTPHARRLGTLRIDRVDVRSARACGL